MKRNFLDLMAFGIVGYALFSLKTSEIVKMLPVRFAFVKGNTYITQRKNIKNLSKLSFNSDNISFLTKQSV